MKIELHIERLVLDGFAAGSIDGEAVRRAMSVVLTRALHLQAPLLGSTALSHIETAALPAAASMHSASLGAGIAQALRGALTERAPAAGIATARNPMAARGRSS